MAEVISAILFAVAIVVIFVAISFATQVVNNVDRSMHVRGLCFPKCSCCRKEKRDQRIKSFKRKLRLFKD